LGRRENQPAGKARLCTNEWENPKLWASQRLQNMGISHEMIIFAEYAGMQHMLILNLAV